MGPAVLMLLLAAAAVVVFVALFIRALFQADEGNRPNPYNDPDTAWEAADKALTSGEEDGASRRRRLSEAETSYFAGAGAHGSIDGGVGAADGGCAGGGGGD